MLVLNLMDWERFNRAAALKESGNIQQALEEFQALAASAPTPGDRAACELNEITCLRLVGHYGQAESRLEGLRHSAESAAIRATADFIQASIYMETGRAGQALPLLDQMLKAYGDLLATDDFRYLSEDVRLLRAYALADLAHFKEAVPLLREAMTYDLGLDDRQRVRLYLGHCYFHLGRKREAEQELLQAATEPAAPDVIAEACYRLGMLYYQGGEFSKAKDSFLKCEPLLLQLKSPAKELYTVIATSCRMLGNTDMANHYARLASLDAG